ncbi:MULTISPECIES: diguanylate cyclase [unclassified Microcoleus]|uniref:GGDEF domain-containing protein n=1 Tax=unclassified Microcoleus TaxID=2642155 RepID=UPI002FD47FEA
MEQENQKLQALANLDKITQLANRDSFDNYLQAEWNRMADRETSLSLILCDIDFFKIYNKAYGHQAGDDCLQKVAQVIRRMVKRPADFAARYGGDEFAIILPQTDGTEAIQIAEQIRAFLKAEKINFNPPNVGGLPSNFVTVSLGVSSTIPDAQNNVASLLAAANKAVQQSKRAERNRVTFLHL